MAQSEHQVELFVPVPPALMWKVTDRHWIINLHPPSYSFLIMWTNTDCCRQAGKEGRQGETLVLCTWSQSPLYPLHLHNLLITGSEESGVSSQDNPSDKLPLENKLLNEATFSWKLSRHRDSASSTKVIRPVRGMGESNSKTVEIMRFAN